MNSFPVPLGVSISCLPHNEVCDTGERYTFTTIPNTTVNSPSVVYEVGTCQTQAAEWRKNFSKFNASNLETQDVLAVANCPYLFVHESHPVINLLRMNKEVLGIDIDATPKMDNQWFKITQSLMQTSCDALRTKVLSKIATQDLTNLHVQLHRVGTQSWDQMDNTDALLTFNADPTWDNNTLQAKLHAHALSFTEKPGVFMARIKLEYEMQR